MGKPNVNEGDWLIIKSSSRDSGINGYVFSVHSDGSLAVGYYQNNAKAIKEDVVWNDSFWNFKYSGPNGTYLRGVDEAIVKRGPSK